MRFITKKAFKQWLSGFPDGSIVGIATTPYQCPIANYVKEIKNDDLVSVSLTSIFFKEEVNPTPLPLWVQMFIKEIDSLGYHMCVTNSHALSILEGIK